MQNLYRFNQEHHLHELNVDGVWKPLIGTSSVLSMIAKPLTYWASGLAVKEFGCPDPKILTKLKNNKATLDEIRQLYDSAGKRLDEIRMMHLEQYVKLLDKAYRAHAANLKETAEEGENLHLELSRFVQFKMGVWSEVEKWTHGKTWNPRITPFIQWTDENVDRFIWSESHCFSRKWHLGGISDCGFIDKQGRMGILDFKSSKSAFENHFLQIALYDIQIEESGGFDPDGNQTLKPMLDPADYYAVLPFGSDDPKPCIRTNTEELKSVALHTLELYKYMNKQEAHD